VQYRNAEAAKQIRQGEAGLLQQLWGGHQSATRRIATLFDQ